MGKQDNGKYCIMKEFMIHTFHVVFSVQLNRGRSESQLFG